MVKLETTVIRSWILSLPTVFKANLNLLNALDAGAGDGDHGTTVLRGFEALAEVVISMEANAKTMLESGALAFRRAAGGAAGPLFSSVLSELAKTASEDGLSLEGFRQGLANAVATVMRLGRVQPGERTMLDALLPAAEAVAREATIAGAIAEAAVASRNGARATEAMIATKGRARFVNAGRVDGPDAGAVSIALMFEALEAVWEDDRS